MTKYDSAADTLMHIKRINHLLNIVIVDILSRAQEHDSSKLTDETEKKLFDEYTPKLKEITYGSEEYNKCLSELKPALEHHYAIHRHHPEHFKNGIEDMNLIDIIEMLMDWKASSERHNDGNIRKSLETNAKRFNLGPKITKILENTINYFGW